MNVRTHARSPGLLIGVMLLILTPAGSAQENDSSLEGIEVIAVGEVARIDAGERSFQLRSLASDGTERPGSGPSSDPLRIGGLSISLGGSVTRGPVTLGGGVGQPGSDAGVPTSPQPRIGDPQSLRYDFTRVLTTETTFIHQNGARVAFELLEAGDRVVVRGAPDGDRIRAADVERRPAPPEDD